jgi:hypothetical protein
MLAPIKFTSNYDLNKNQNVSLNSVQRSPILSKQNVPQDTLSFSGKTYPSRWYSEWFINSVKGKIHLEPEEYGRWVKERVETYKQSFGFFDTLFGKADKHATIRKRDHYDLRSDLIKEKLARESAEATSTKGTAKGQSDYDKKIFYVHEQLKTKFSDLIQLEKEGNKVKVPNCIMLVGNDQSITNELIKKTGEQSKSKFVEIKHTDDLLDHMEKAEAHFQKTRERSLIHVENFDRLINPELTDNSTIAACKDLMQCSSEDYHSTIIFSTKDPKKLDEAATSGHRITSIEADIKKPEPVAELPKEEPIEPDDANYSSYDDNRNKYSSGGGGGSDDSCSGDYWVDDCGNVHGLD